jgi:hypothetical protein
MRVKQPLACTLTSFVGLTALLISCKPPHMPAGDAARPLPRLKMYSAGVTCNGRDAVAHVGAGALAPGQRIGGLPAALVS